MPTTRPSSTTISLHGELLADLGAGFRRRVHQQLVEHGAARAVGHRSGLGARRARERERPEVERVRVDRGAPGRDQSVEQAPSLHRLHRRGVEDVGRDRVARELRPVDDEHLVALAGQQHRGRRAGAARPHHDCVVSVLAHVASCFGGCRAMAIRAWAEVRRRSFRGDRRPPCEHRRGPLFRGADLLPGREGGRLGPVPQTQLRQDPADVVLDGLARDVEPVGDLGIRQPRADAAGAPRLPVW